MVRGQGLGAAPAPARNAGAGAARAKRAAGRGDRRRQDAGGIPADDLRACGGAGGRAPHALRLATEGAGGRRPAQPDRPDRGNGAADPGRDPHRRHALGPQGAAAREAAAGAADHARVAEPAAELSRIGADVREAADDRRRRASRLRQGEARRPAVAVDVAAAEAGARAAAGRPVGDDQRSRRLPLAGSRPMPTWSWSTWSSAIRAPSRTCRS